MLKPPDHINVAELAQKCLAAAKGDIGVAAKLMEQRVRADDRLYKALLDPMVRNECYEAVRKCVRQNRGVIWHMPQPSAEEHRERVGHLADATLLDFQLPIPGAMKLGDAEKSDVLEAVAFYDKQATDMHHKKRWLELVAKRLKEGQRVRDAFSAEQLFALRKKASAHAHA